VVPWAELQPLTPEPDRPQPVASLRRETPPQARFGPPADQPAPPSANTGEAPIGRIGPGPTNAPLLGEIPEDTSFVGGFRTAPGDGAADGTTRASHGHFLTQYTFGTSGDTQGLASGEFFLSPWFPGIDENSPAQPSGGEISVFCLVQGVVRAPDCVNGDSVGLLTIDVSDFHEGGGHVEVTGDTSCGDNRFVLKREGACHVSYQIASATLDAGNRFLQLHLSDGPVGGQLPENGDLAIRFDQVIFRSYDGDAPDTVEFEDQSQLSAGWNLGILPIGGTTQVQTQFHR
jgi:hypothetical protein